VVSLSYYPYLYDKKPEIKDQFTEWSERLFGTIDVNIAFAKYRETFVLFIYLFVCLFFCLFVYNIYIIFFKGTFHGRRLFL
jgi:hypothetical protein